MKPLRKNVAIAIDGGGIRGIIPAMALTMLEKELGKPLHEAAHLHVGTSTGSIIAASLACGVSTEQLLDMYKDIGDDVFKKTLASRLWFFRGYRYNRDVLRASLKKIIGDKTMGDLWKSNPRMALVTTTFDMVENFTRFIKSWKPNYADWLVVDAVLASSAAPTYFRVLKGQYSDGGIGSYNNPCFIAAYEMHKFLGWNMKETTLISLGTGRAPYHVKAGEPDSYNALQWLPHVMETLTQDATDQQVHLVRALYPDLDFRRFQVDLNTPIALDDPAKIPELLEYGKRMGDMLLADEVDHVMKATYQLPVQEKPARKPRRTTVKVEAKKQKKK